MFTLPYGQHRFTRIVVGDKLGEGNSHHVYNVEDVDDNEIVYAFVRFQKGPVKMAGKNGCFMEDLLHICQHRLECFQAGEFACAENAEALDHVKKALAALDRRTRDRQQRGVEGTNNL